MPYIIASLIASTITSIISVTISTILVFHLTKAITYDRSDDTTTTSDDSSVNVFVDTSDDNRTDGTDAEDSYYCSVLHFLGLPIDLIFLTPNGYVRLKRNGFFGGI